MEVFKLVVTVYQPDVRALPWNAKSEIFEVWGELAFILCLYLGFYFYPVWTLGYLSLFFGYLSLSVDYLSLSFAICWLSFTIPRYRSLSFNYYLSLPWISFTIFCYLSLSLAIFYYLLAIFYYILLFHQVLICFMSRNETQNCKIFIKNSKIYFKMLEKNLS